MKVQIRSFIAAAAALCMIMTASGSMPAAAQAGYRVPCGSFLNLGSTASWDDARWQDELNGMKNAGMRYLILLYSATVDEDSQKTTAYYPSGIAGLKKGYVGADLVDDALRNSEKAGIKVFVGLNYSKRFWKFGWDVAATNPADYSAFWKANTNLSNEMADELARKYKPKYPNAFYGWYWVHEFWNYSICTKTYECNTPAGSKSWAPNPDVYTDMIAKEAFNPVLSHLSSLDKNMPMLFSPFANRSLCSSAGSIERFWSNIIKKTDFRPGDIICPQDSIGGGGVQFENLDEMCAAYKNAAAQNKNLHLWSNNETFVKNVINSVSDTNETALLDRVVRQIAVTSKYCEANVTFAWNHYYNPLVCLEGFNKTYLQYVRTGSIEKNPPSAVDFKSMTEEESSGGRYLLCWKEPYDDTGVAVYRIYQNGRLVTHVYATRYNCTNREPVLNTWAVLPKGAYQIEAVDCAGNVSKRTSFTIGAAANSSSGNIVKTSSNIPVMSGLPSGASAVSASGSSDSQNNASGASSGSLVSPAGSSAGGGSSAGAAASSDKSAAAARASGKPLTAVVILIIIAVLAAAGAGSFCFIKIKKGK